MHEHRSSPGAAGNQFPVLPAVSMALVFAAIAILFSVGESPESRGRRDADQEYASGNPAWRGGGLVVDPWPVVDEEYGIPCRQIAGCVIDEDTGRYIDAYNSRLSELIESGGLPPNSQRVHFVGIQSLVDRVEASPTSLTPGERWLDGDVVVDWSTRDLLVRFGAGGQRRVPVPMESTHMTFVLMEDRLQVLIGFWTSQGIEFAVNLRRAYLLEQTRVCRGDEWCEIDEDRTRLVHRHE